MPPTPTPTPTPTPATGARRIAVAGNPNAGKTTLFNRLTGLRARVGNYPGVTVDRKEGSCLLEGQRAVLLDLPGAYSLTVQSPDEEIARDVLFDWREDCPPPEALLVVIDATNPERNLFLATQMLELGYPSVLALNMIDVARSRGTEIDVPRLEELLGVPCVPTVATTGEGTEALAHALLNARATTLRAPLKPPVAAQVEKLAETLVGEHGVGGGQAPAIALRLLSSPGGLSDAATRYGQPFADQVSAAREALKQHGLVWQGCEASSRYAWLRKVAGEAIHSPDAEHRVTTTDRIDRVLTHRIWGLVIFVAVMAFVFQSIFTFAQPFMDAVGHGADHLGAFTKAHLPAGVLTDLLANGVIAGLGTVFTFLPQILMLFFFLVLLEDSGYMARAAFVMDRVMSRVGLHGRSFVPLLSSFACAIPGIMAARTIANRRDRLTTILIAPMMTCSARLPVYGLLIASFVPARRLGGVIPVQGLVMLALYALGLISALLIASIFKRTVLRGPTPAMLLELPPYRWPHPPNVVRELWERSFLFVRFAGTIILSICILLWVLAAFPKYDAPPEQLTALAAAQLGPDAKPEDLAAAEDRIGGQQQLEHSILGRAGHIIEPLVRPLGFDWRIGIGLLSASAAREVFVSTLGVIFAVGDKAEATDQTLIERLRLARWPDGRLLFTPAAVASLLIFFVYAMQCISTVSVVVRETGGWKWAAFQIAYLGIVAYSLSFVTYQGLRAAGWG
jgi:ferrous iron transport protein B